MTETVQRIGRNLYRKVKIAVTNPAHLMPSARSTNKTKLRLDKRYEAGKVEQVTDRTPSERTK